MSSDPTHSVLLRAGDRLEAKQLGHRTAQALFDWALTFWEVPDRLEQEMVQLLHSWRDFSSLQLFASVVGATILAHKPSEVR